MCLSSTPKKCCTVSLNTNYSGAMKHFPAVINYKTCCLPTHSSLSPFAPFVTASIFISLYPLAPSSEFSLAPSLSYLPSPHFTSSFCLLHAGPLQVFPLLLAAFLLIYGFSHAVAVYLWALSLLALLNPRISLCLEFYGLVQL